MAKRASLWRWTGFEGAWDGLLREWFAGQAAHAWRKRKPVVVVTPDRAAEAFLKSRLTGEGTAVFNVRFRTPGQLRQQLLEDFFPARRLAVREDLHLLAAVSADEISVNDPSAAAIAAHPDDFPRAWDGLTAAGRSAGDFSHESWRRTGRRLEEHLAKAGLWSARQADHALAEAAENADPVFADLLLHGFNASHWDLFPLLKAAMLAAENAAASLPETGPAAAEQVWMGTWEETFGEGSYMPAAEKTGLEKLAEKYALIQAGDSAPGEILYFAGRDAQEEARAVVAQAAEWLARDNCGRLGIVVPPGTELARETAACLAEAGLPHNDALGHYPAPSARQLLLDAWVALQEDPRLALLLPFAHLLEENGRNSAGPPKQIGTDVEKAFRNTLSDDITAVREWLRQADAESPALTLLDTWPVLPPAAPFDLFFDLAAPFLDLLGWPSEAAELKEKARPFLETLTRPVKRENFLRWLAGRLRTPGRQRHPLGRVPFGCIQILAYPRAAGQSFSHLILAGLNSRIWPPESRENPFLSETRIAELNRQGQMAGSQGEGHVAMKDGLGWLSSSADRLRMAQSAFTHLLASVTENLACSVSLAIGARPALASDFLLKLAYADTGKMPNEEMMAEWQKNTARRLKIKETQTAMADLAPMRRAYRARRDPQTPFGEHMFAFREPPPEGFRLSCGAWAVFLKRPAQVWMKKALGIARPANFSEAAAWPLITGLWVHDWLRFEEEGFRNRPGGREWKALARDKAERFRKQAAQAYDAAGRQLPDWWLCGWERAKALAEQFARSLGAAGWPRAATELKLPRGAFADAGKSRRLPVTGRVDAVFSRAASDAPGPDGWPAGGTLWVVDIKTGRDKALSAKGLQKGEGWQLALYLMALLQLGETRAEASILGPEMVLAPQISAADVQAAQAILEGIYAVYESGAAGMAGPLRSEYRFVGDYPLASLPVREDILARKWEITHPSLPYPKP